MVREIKRYVVATGDKWQRVPLKGPVLQTFLETPTSVEFFAVSDTDIFTVYREFRLVNTGEVLPGPPLEYHGSVVRPAIKNLAREVWHLVSRRAR